MGAAMAVMAFIFGLALVGAAPGLRRGDSVPQSAHEGHDGWKCLLSAFQAVDEGIMRFP